VYRQRADVAARKKQRRNDMAVGADHQPPSGHGKQRLVVTLPQQVVVEMLDEQFVDQLSHRAAASAVA
jgi:hypothetical protein